MSLRQILAEVETERGAQDREHGGPEHDDTLSMNDWIAIIVRHLGLAANDEAKTDAVRYRKQLIRVAATCAAAVEALDRQTGRDHGAGPDPSIRGHGH